MNNRIHNIIKETVKKLKEQSSTGAGGASFTPGEGMQKASKYSFAKKPKKPSGLEVVKLFEYNDFQQERITVFETIENELNSLFPLLSNAKNDTAEFYSENPGSYEVVTSTDLILDYIKDIKTLLKGEEWKP